MKMLKSKNIRRICVLLAMLAPVVYLFGSLFSALNGAHGTEVFAEPVYIEQYVEVDSFNGVGDYRYILDADSFDDYIAGVPNSDSLTAMPVAHFDGETYGAYRKDTNMSGIAYFFIKKTVYDEPHVTLALRTDGGSWSAYQNLPWTFEFFDVSSSPLVVYGVGTLFQKVLAPVGDVVDGPGAYSDYVFKNFFAKDNFLEQIGKDVLSDNPHGFVPFASFWKYLDNNMLHMGNMQLGLMGYGYVYYCCHVLLFDIAFILVTFFLDFIQKVNDKVVGGVD